MSAGSPVKERLWISGLDGAPPWLDADGAGPARRGAALQGPAGSPWQAVPGRAAPPSVPSQKFVGIRPPLRPPGCVAPPRRMGYPREARVWIRLRRRALPGGRSSTLGATTNF